jgi:hypothetical protein
MDTLPERRLGCKRFRQFNSDGVCQRESAIVNDPSYFPAYFT